LVNVLTIRRGPRAPLVSVHRTELAVRVRPLVPDRDFVLVEVADVRIAAKEPKQLDDDRAEVHLLRRHERKAGAEVETELAAEKAEGAGAGAVGFRRPVVEDVADEFEVLLHAPF
jgi:hypothetical protein